MELASQPPPSHNVYHNFPHIIIGGQPFYLIPSDPEDCAAFETGDPSYAYPQNVAPIYEEIDPDHEEATTGWVSSSAEVAAGNWSQAAAAGHSNNPVRNSRVVTSDVASSEYNSSAQSDQGEAGSDTSSLRRQPRPQKAAPLGRLVVNPMERQQPPHRSPASSTGSSSMYYYSDTMKNPSKQPKKVTTGNWSQAAAGHTNRLSDDFSDSGFSHRSNSKRKVKQGLGSSNSSNSESVDTKVVVEKEEDAASTLV